MTHATGSRAILITEELKNCEQKSCARAAHRGSFKRYPEIGDRPKKVLSNPPKVSIEPLKRFYRTLQKLLSNPVLAPKRVL